MSHDLAVLVDGAPQVMKLATDLDEDFVQVPDIAEGASTPLEILGQRTRART